jgi:hypothetical protein
MRAIPVYVVYGICTGTARTGFRYNKGIPFVRISLLDFRLHTVCYILFRKGSGGSGTPIRNVCLHMATPGSVYVKHNTCIAVLVVSTSV